MTNNVRLSGLPDASEDATADVAAVQGGATKKFTLGSAAGKTAGTAAGQVPVLATGGVLAAAQGGTGLNLADNAAQPSRYFGRDAAGVLGFHSLPSGGGGGGGATDVTWSQTAASARADEEDILDGAETADTKFVGNKTLRDVLGEVDNSVDWGAWSSPAIVNSNVPFTGSSHMLMTSDLPVNVDVFHATEHNAGTKTLAKGALHLYTTACSGLPSLSSGTLRGLLVITNDMGERWGLTIANPEGPDAQATWQYVGGDGGWVARGYRGNELRTAYAGLFSGAAWEIFSSLARGGPTANEFDDEVCFAKRDGRRRWIVRAVFDTANNPNRFRIISSSSEYAFDIANREIVSDYLADGAVITRTIADEAVENGKIKAGTIQLSRLNITGKAANKYLSINASNNGLAAVDAPSGGTPSITEEAIYSNSSGLASSSSFINLSSGKSFADYNEIYFCLSGGGCSPVFSIISMAGQQAQFVGKHARDQGYGYVILANLGSLNTFQFTTNDTTLKLLKIIGRKFS